MSTPVEIAQVLREAAALLKRTGWRRFAYSDRDSRGHESFCILGAINRVVNSGIDPDLNYGARAAVSAVLSGLTIVDFNDRIATRRSKVIAVLLEAAEKVEATA